MSGLLPYEPKKNWRKKVQEEKRSTFSAVRTFFRSNSFPYSNIDTGGIKKPPLRPHPLDINRTHHARSERDESLQQSLLHFMP